LAIVESLREKARSLKPQTPVLYFAVRDPRVPLIAKILAGFVVAYALSPLDLIPDFIPVLGYLDDLILVPLGIALCLRLIPEPVLVEARARVEKVSEKPKSYSGGIIIIVLWAMGFAIFSLWIYRLFVAGDVH
jgi:uncharacterized membrane protein YkvA (DUF1232 family)